MAHMRKGVIGKHSPRRSGCPARCRHRLRMESQYQIMPTFVQWRFAVERRVECTYSNIRYPGGTTTLAENLRSPEARKENSTTMMNRYSEGTYPWPRVPASEKKKSGESSGSGLSRIISSLGMRRRRAAVGGARTPLLQGVKMICVRPWWSEYKLGNTMQVPPGNECCATHTPATRNTRK